MITASGPRSSAATTSAMEVARSLIRCGVPEVTIIHPRPKTEMSANQRNIRQAEGEGVQFLLMASPVNITQTDQGLDMELMRMRLSEPDARGIRHPEAIARLLQYPPGRYHRHLAGADGLRRTFMVGGELESTLELTPANNIKANPRTSLTNHEGIFAAGDVTSGSRSVIQTVVAARRAAENIHAQVMGTGKDAGREPLQLQPRPDLRRCRSAQLRGHQGQTAREDADPAAGDLHPGLRRGQDRLQREDGPERGPALPLLRLYRLRTLRPETALHRARSRSQQDRHGHQADLCQGHQPSGHRRRPEQVHLLPALQKQLRVRGPGTLGRILRREGTAAGNQADLQRQVRQLRRMRRQLLHRRPEQEGSASSPSSTRRSARSAPPAPTAGRAARSCSRSRATP